MTRLASFDDHRVGVVIDDRVFDVTTVLPPAWQGTRYAMTELITAYDELRDNVHAAAERSPGQPLDAVRLLPPVPAPRHLLAAPLNYRKHVDEMAESSMVSSSFVPSSALELGFFLKAPGSLVGASGAIELPPLAGRRFDHEAELGVVIGRNAQALAVEEALDAVFGYTCLLDITMRNGPDHAQERVMRKSYATFTPVGPVLVTADEVGDPTNLRLTLSVGDELRQAASTAEMIMGVAELIATASHVVPLEPGDLYATGTPDGVGPIEPGDTVTLVIDRVGELSMNVRNRSW